MIDLLPALIAAGRVFFRSRADTALEVLALRQQVVVLKRKHPRPTVNRLDRVLWTWLRQVWPRWKDALVIVKLRPSSAGTAQDSGFTGAGAPEDRAVGPHCPSFSAGARAADEIRTLIRRIAAENAGWGARTSDAITALQKAFDLIEEWTRNDAQGTLSRLFYVSIGRELGGLLRSRHPERALAVYDHSLLRLGTLLNNAEARRGEAVLLAGSAYALRHLGRNDEAGRRIDAAFRVITEAEYAMPRTSRNTTMETLLRARGDHFAGVGQLRRAVEIYEELVSRLEVSKLDPHHDLRDANAVSETYASLAALYRRGSMPHKADALYAHYVELWRWWKSRLPNKIVAQRQLQLVAAR